MSEKSRRINHEPAFLLAAVPWRESSLRLEMYSRSYGRVSLLARSARKRQSELRGVLVPFVPVSVSWYGSGETKTLHRAEWLGGWPQPQGRVLLSGLYLNELVLKLTPREDAQPAVYDALAQALRSLCTNTAHAAALRRFEWRLLTELGYAPDLHTDINGDPVSAGRRYLIEAEQPPQPCADGSIPQGVLTADGADLAALREGVFDNGESLRQALKITRMLLDFYLPEGIRSRHVLQQMQRFAPPALAEG
ncbi:Recombination protein O [Kingella potus]|uniref:DNA repair protein RecO n=1 Tax=Kingella potus TaxID=265175 RepID=A0A377R184_9NEIS|nr:DNA repair protein RecO [Kingella potus]STR01012.1 Recombination protein O [Kingella potus]